jgi:hypothetical protein
MQMRHHADAKALGMAAEIRAESGSEERRVGLVYKVVELSMVSEEEIEAALNQWTAEGWTFDNMQFAMRDSSKRPAMAFISFTRQESEPAGD